MDRIDQVLHDLNKAKDYAGMYEVMNAFSLGAYMAGAQAVSAELAKDPDLIAKIAERLREHRG